MPAKKSTTIKHTLKLEGFGPLFEETDLRRVMENQNYRGYKKAEFESIVEELNINESLEDLLASLK